MSEFTEEDRHHGIVIELDVLQKCSIHLEWIDNLGKAPIKFKEVKKDNCDEEFVESLCNYEEIYCRESFYIIINITKELQMLRRIFIN